MDNRFPHPAGDWLGLLPQLGQAQATSGGIYGAAERAGAADEAEFQAARQRWADLLRQRNFGGLEQSNALGPAEHGAYSEMRVREHPVFGTVEQLALIPAYEATKASGLLGLLGLADETTSPPSLDSMAEGYRGVGRGLGLLR